MNTQNLTAVSARLPEDLLQQMRLVVVGNKNKRNGPVSQNAIFIEAVRDWLQKNNSQGVTG